MIPLNLTLLTLFYFTNGYAISPLSLLSAVTLNIRVIDHQACLVKRLNIGQVFFFLAFEFPFSLSFFANFCLSFAIFLYFYDLYSLLSFFLSSTVVCVPFCVLSSLVRFLFSVFNSIFHSAFRFL